MRRALTIAPELLADGKLDASEKLAASLLDSLAGASGTDAINDDLAEALGVSVSKVKQMMGTLITERLIRVDMTAGNQRIIHSLLPQYVVRRRGELGWAADAPAPTAAPTAAPTPPAAAPAPQPPPATPPPAAIAGTLFGAVEPAEPVAGGDGPTDEEIYREYPRKIEKKAALRAIQAARREVAAELRRAREPEPGRRAAELLLERTREYAAVWLARLASAPDDKRFIPYPQRWYNQRRWDDDGRDDWRGTIATPNGPRGGGPRRTAEQRGQYAEPGISAPIEYFGGGRASGGRATGTDGGG